MTCKLPVSESETPEWITGPEARRLLGWQSTASVRNAAQQRGAFEFRKGDNGFLEYSRAGVLAYRERARRGGFSEAA